MTDAPIDPFPRWLEYVAVADIVPAEANPKLHDLDEIQASMARFGYTAPIEVDERTGKLVAGHGRLEVLTALEAFGARPEWWDEETPWPPEGVVVGEDSRWQVPLVRGWQSRNDQEAQAYLVAANALTMRAGWDAQGLATMLSGLDDLSGVGYSRDELDLLLGQLEANRTPEPQPQPTPIAPPEHPVTVRGDVWLLGPHRVMCGDCRNADDVATLLDGASINLAFTSPPYADRREYDESSGFQPIPPDDYVDWFELVSANVATHLAEDGSWFVNIKPPGEGLDTNLYVMDLVIAHARRWGWHFATEFCWERLGVPKHITMRFKNQFEPVYQFTRGRWKIRPENVRHWSEGAVIPLGPGSGIDTGWADKQGQVDCIPAKNQRGRGSRDLAFAQGGQKPFIYPEQTYRPGGPMEHRQGAGGAAGGQIGAKKRKRKAVNPRGELSLAEHQGGGGDVFDRPRDGAGPDVADLGHGGWAYPGNRLPTFIGSHEATGHSAAFPVGLPEWFVKAYTDPGDTVYDPFVGSGSTVLAAHQQDRVGYGMELSPAYVDIVLMRWQRHTGIRPVRAATGEPVDFAIPAPADGQGAGPAVDPASEPAPAG